MKIQKIPLNPSDIFNYSSAKITKCGDVVEVLTIGDRNRKAHIKKIDKNTYEVLSTHEIRQFNHDVSRNNSLAQSFVNLRHIINANITTETAKNVLWVTLTYAENMTDTKCLYTDFKKFIQRLRYYFKKNDLPYFEYITVVEPQARGAWHHHLLLIWDFPAPFIPNSLMAEKWGFGFTRVQSLNLKKDITNIGKYLTAYLTDIDLDNKEELAEVADKLPDKACKIKNVNGKRYVKGARIHMYPKNMRIFRHSRGIKLPEQIRTSRKNALEMMTEQNAELQYSAAYFMSDDKSKYSNTIYKEYFNVSPLAQSRVRLVKSSKKAKINKYLFNEFVMFQSILTEFAEYYQPPYAELFDDFFEEICSQNES